MSEKKTKPVDKYRLYGERPVSDKTAREWLVDRIEAILREEESVLDPADADNLAHVIVDRLFSKDGPRVEQKIDEVLRAAKDAAGEAQGSNPDSDVVDEIGGF